MHPLFSLFFWACQQPTGFTFDEATGAYFKITEHPNLNLAAIVQVESPNEVALEVEVSATGVPPWRTYRSASTTNHELIVVGMRANTEYLLEPVLIEDSGEESYIRDTLHTTGALPSGIADFSITTNQPHKISPGITLFGMEMEDIYGIGIDTEGQVVWYYEDPKVNSEYIVRQIKPLADGNLLLMLSQEVRIIKPTGETVLQFKSQDLPDQRFHHDALQLPNGNYVLLVEEVRTVNSETLGSRVDIRGDIIMEISPYTGETVWEWSTFDNLDTNRFPSELSLRTGLDDAKEAYDWMHGNSLFYHEQDSSILYSSRSQSWVVSISRETGKVNWKLGKGGDFALTTGEWFYAQHSPSMLSKNQILLYDNGNERPDTTNDYSRAVIYDLDIDTWEATEQWSYTTEHYTPRLGNTSSLANGNVLICAGDPHLSNASAQIIEVDQQGNEVWTLDAAKQNIYRAYKIRQFYTP